MNNKMEGIKSNNIRCFINSILGIFSAVFTLAASVLIILNLTPIYSWAIKKYKLSEQSGLTSKELMDNYKDLIYYLQNPFTTKLMFKNFSMSIQGEIHFQDVKRLIMYMYIYIFIIMILLGLYLLLEKKFIYKHLINKKAIINSTANYLIIFFILLITCILVDFSKYFKIFHKIFFTNNYWLFDPKLDPIINVLPEEFFMLLGSIILILLFIQSIYFKIYYYSNNK